MFFTHTCRVFGWLIFLGMAFRIGMAVYIGSAMEGAAYDAAIARYLGSYASTGEVIDKSLARLVIGAGLGLAAEISLTLRKIANAVSG